jgi:hypothetical protein
MLCKHGFEVKRDLVRCLSQTPLTARSSKTLKQSLPLKTTKKEFRLKRQIQNSVPAVIDHANMAFQSSFEMFVGVDHSRHALSTFSFWHFPRFFVLVLARFENAASDPAASRF